MDFTIVIHSDLNI